MSLIISRRDRVVCFLLSRGWIPAGSSNICNAHGGDRLRLIKIKANGVRLFVTVGSITTFFYVGTSDGPRFGRKYRTKVVYERMLDT